LTGISAPSAKAELVMAKSVLLACGVDSGVAGLAQPAIVNDVIKNKLINTSPIIRIPVTSHNKSY
jgi:hypothetical protein